MIHQLARESNLDVYALGLDKAKWDYRLNEYTLLVVKECIKMIENEATTYAEPVWAVEIINDMKDRFGIKETNYDI